MEEQELQWYGLEQGWSNSSSNSGVAVSIRFGLDLNFDSNLIRNSIRNWIQKLARKLPIEEARPRNPSLVFARSAQVSRNFAREKLLLGLLTALRGSAKMP